MKIIILLLLASLSGIGAFFVLPAHLAWIGFVIFGVAVVSMLIEETFFK